MDYNFTWLHFALGQNTHTRIHARAPVLVYARVCKLNAL